MTCSACHHRTDSICAMFRKRTEGGNYCHVSDRDPMTFKLPPQYSGRGFDGFRYYNPMDEIDTTA